MESFSNAIIDITTWVIVYLTVYKFFYIFKVRPYGA
jgi:hypothetical protein